MTGWRRAAVWPVAFSVHTAIASAAAPQLPPEPPRADVAVGVMFTAAMPLGDASADLIRPDGSPLALFRSDVTVRPGPGLEVHVSRRILARWSAELSGTWAVTDIQTRVSSDFEDVPAATLTERLSRFSIEGSALWIVAGGPTRSVFVRAGAGWMREVAGAATLAEDGIIGSAGAGVKSWWRRATPGGGRRWGVRLDGRAVFRARGVDLGADTVRVAPAAAADLLFGF